MKKAKTNPNLLKPAYSIRELLEILPISRSALFHDIKSGKLKVKKYGKRKIIILAEAIDDYLDSMDEV